MRFDKENRSSFLHEAIIKFEGSGVPLEAMGWKK
jgi:hypothetical protein